MGSRLLLGLFVVLAVGAVVWVALSGGGPAVVPEGETGPAPRPDEVVTPPPVVPTEPAVADDDERPDEPDVVDGTGTLLVTVTDPEKLALAGCVVRAEGRTETTGSDGIVRFADLPAGKRILVQAEGPNPNDVLRSARVRLKKGQETKQTLVVHPGGAVRGVVRGPGGTVLTVPFTIQVEPTAVTGSWSGRLNQVTVSKSFPAGDGSFTFPRIRPGGYVARAIAKGFVPADSKPFRVGEGATKEGVEIELGVGGSIAGIVIDRETGEPMVGVRIGLREGRGGHFISSGSGFDRLGNKAWVTDAQGAFRIEDVAPGTWHLTAAAKGRPAVTVQGVEVVAGAETGGLRVAIGRGATITGTVYGPDGNPLPKKPVLIQPVLPNFQFEGDYGRRVQTDANGVYRAEGLKPGRYRVKLPASDRMGEISIAFSGGSMDGQEPEKPKDPLGENEVEVADGQVVTKDLRADPRGTINGTVKSRDGKPLRQMVRLKRIEEKKQDPATPRIEIPRMESPDEKGVFEFEGLEPGRWRVSCGDVTETVDVGPGETVDVPFVLSPARVEGIVVDGAGKPVAGARVSASRLQQLAGDPFSGGRVSSVKSGADGRFVFPQVFSGTWTFRASKDGADGASGQVEVVPAGLVRDVRIELVTPTELRVRVVDKEGKPIAGARVTANARKTGDSKHGMTDAGGVAVLKIQGGADYTVMAWRDGLAMKTTEVRVERGVAAETEITLE